MKALAAAIAVALSLPGAAAAPRRAVLAAVASNLKPAFEDLSRAFEASHPEVEVRATYGASGNFYAQLRGGAPFDLFLSADAEFPAKLSQDGLAAAPPFTYAFGTLVVWVPASSPLDLEGRGLAALADSSVRRIAIANPRVAPYGRAAEAALRAAGVYERVKDRLVLGQNVAQTAQFAHTGNAQAALVPLSLAEAPPLATEGRRWKIPEDGYERIRQDGVVLKGAREPRAAQDLAAFLRGPGRAILEKHGYALPER